jgi:hypothetical protein
VFTITVTNPTNGTITPSGTISVNYGGSQTFTITPNAGYRIDSIFVNGAYVGNTSPYTLSNITGNSSITVKFAIRTYTITVTQGANGTIAPGSATVNYGANQTFSVTPNTGYHIDSVIVDGANVGAGTSVTFNNVTANHTLTARYAIDVFTITVTNPTNGTITPSGTISVNYGGSQTFIFAPNTGYHIDSVFIDGIYVGTPSNYTLNNINSNHTVSAKYAINSYTISSSSGANGSISPLGNISVNYGASQTFTITPNSGFQIDSVIVDGIYIGAATAYSFNNINANHTIVAKFKIEAFSITVTNPTNGTITPSGTITVTYGGSQTFTLTPNNGYHIESIVVNGVNAGNTSPFTLSNIIGNSTITVTFGINVYSIIATANTGGSITPSGTISVNSGGSASFTISASTGYHIDSVYADGMYIGAVNSYTFNNVIANHSLTAKFAINTFSIFAITGSNGTVSPLGNVVVNYGTNPAFTFLPENGFRVDSIFVDDLFAGDSSSYTFSNVESNHTIFVTFRPLTYTITATAGANGTISPTGAISVNPSGSLFFNIIPNSGYRVANVVVDGISQGTIETYLFSNVNADHSIAATFTVKTYTINATSDANGNVFPSGNVTVNHGTNQTFSIIANVGYHIDSVLVDGANVGPVGNYTFNSITGNHTIRARFAFNTYTIVATANENGIITPSGVVNVNPGGSISFNITPNGGYRVADVVVDGNSVGTVTSYQFVNVIANHTISASFAVNTYLINSSASANGNIAPSGNISVNHGSSQTYSMTPAAGYHIDSVIIDGVHIGNGANYTFNNVSANHTILVKFAINIYTITSSMGLNGTITPFGLVNVPYAGNKTFVISPNEGFHIDSVFVDGSYIGVVPTYTFSTVTENHTIGVTFAINTYIITALSGNNGTISPAGSVVVNHSQSQTFSFIPNAGYRVANIILDGEISLGSVNAYTFENVTAPHSIYVSFMEMGYFVVASAGVNGSIFPSGTAYVAQNGAKTYSINANAGYHIDSVIVDGVNVGQVASYTFVSVSADHTIRAKFAINTYVITAISGNGGTISPAGAISLTHGITKQFSIVPSVGYHIDSVIVDGEFIGALSSYTFENVTANHSISVSFGINIYSLEVNIVGGGTVSISPEQTGYPHGSQTTLTAAVSRGYLFQGWSGSIASQLNPIILTMDSNITVTAMFIVDSSYFKAYRTMHQTDSLSQKSVRLILRKGKPTPNPNIGTMRDVILSGGIFSTGVRFVNNNDSALTYAWLQWRDGGDFKKFMTSVHSGKSYPLDSLRTNSKKVKKLSKYAPNSRKKYNNRLAAEQSMFKFNIRGSFKGTLPMGFGNLVYKSDGAFPRWDVFDTLTLMQISEKVDTILTIYQRYGFGDSLSLYESLADFLARFNNAFYSNYLDTNDLQVVTLDSVRKVRVAALKVRGTKQLIDVPFLEKARTYKNATPSWYSAGNEQGALPVEFLLEQNYPNPFNPTTNIQFSMSEPAVVTMKVYNLIGQEVATLAENESFGEGNHELKFNASQLSSGIYFYRMIATVNNNSSGNQSSFTSEKKMLLLK